MSTCIEAELVARAAEVITALKKRELTVVTAESCTAGLIAACLSQGEGASDVLQGGFVTYTKEHKAKALGVSREVLEREGSVNETVAAQLARGALARSPAGVAIAVTGVLGPSPDEDGNPVGLVYLCCCHKGGEPKVVRKQYGTLPHDTLRRRVVVDALDLLNDC